MPTLPPEESSTENLRTLLSREFFPVVQKGENENRRIMQEKTMLTLAILFNPDREKISEHDEPLWREIPEGAKQLFQEYREFVRKNPGSEPSGIPLRSIIVWGLGDHIGGNGERTVDNLAQIFKTRFTRRDVFYGNTLFHLIHGSIYSGNNREIYQRLLQLNTENNTGLLVQEILRRHSEGRKLEYIRLIEELLSLPECNLESIIVHQGHPYSLLDFIREHIAHEEEYNPEKYRYGDYHEIMRILEQRGTKTASTILSEQSVEVKIPLERIAVSRSPFGDLSLPSNPNGRLYTDN